MRRLVCSAWLGLLEEPSRRKIDSYSTSICGRKELQFPKKERKMKQFSTITATWMSRECANGKCALQMNGKPLKNSCFLNFWCPQWIPLELRFWAIWSWPNLRLHFATMPCYWWEDREQPKLRVCWCTQTNSTRTRCFSKELTSPLQPCLVCSRPPLRRNATSR